MVSDLWHEWNGEVHDGIQADAAVWTNRKLLREAQDFLAGFILHANQFGHRDLTAGKLQCRRRLGEGTCDFDGHVAFLLWVGLIKACAVYLGKVG